MKQRDQQKMYLSVQVPDQKAIVTNGMKLLAWFESFT